MANLETSLSMVKAKRKRYNVNVRIHYFYEADRMIGIYSPIQGLVFWQARLQNHISCCGCLVISSNKPIVGTSNKVLIVWRQDYSLLQRAINKLSCVYSQQELDEILPKSEFVFFKGSINNQQASVGKISGFQLFSRYMIMEEIKITGCGYKADVFDSFYREFDIFGDGSTYIVEENSVSFCSDESGTRKAF